MNRKLLMTLFFSAILINSVAQDIKVDEAMKGFDEYMSKILTEWNVPGAGVAIVYKDRVVYQKGFGYRDLENKLPVTEQTLYRIASDTKLFTTIAAGFLVEEGVLAWDEPIREYVPELEFYNEQLNTQVTLRDMLGHKTGINRHDFVWFDSDLSLEEIVDGIRYLKPVTNFRQDFLYNNMMYAAVGYIIELKTGKTWSEFVREKLISPLNMDNTIFHTAEMKESDNYALPYNEDIESGKLMEMRLAEYIPSTAPGGSIISNLTDMSHWVIALLNDGEYMGNAIIPPSILKESLVPGLAVAYGSDGYDERLNLIYCMGREIEVYKGNLLTKHGGDLMGFHTNVAILPEDSVGIITFVNGDHGAPLKEIIIYNVVDRLLNLEQTDWHNRFLSQYIKGKEIFLSTRTAIGEGRVEGTSPTHGIEYYAGTYDNELYGELVVDYANDSLYLDFRNKRLPLLHYHYNRFDTPSLFAGDYPLNLRWSLNFQVNHEGDIESVTIPIDGDLYEFEFKPGAVLSDPETLRQYVGNYAGSDFELEVLLEGQQLKLFSPQVNDPLVPYKENIFKIEGQEDVQVEFVIEDNTVLGLKLIVDMNVLELNKV